MDLYILRHGLIDPYSSNPLNPGLSIDEKNHLEKHFAFLSQELNGDDTLILSSPMKRAEETAEIIQRVSNSHSAVMTSPLVISSGIIAYDHLISYNRETIVLVGHHPFVSDWYEQLSGENKYFDRADMARFHYDKDTGWRLVWFKGRNE